MAYVEISFADESEKQQTAGAVEEHLLKDLARENEQSANEDFVLKATDDSGQLLGGLSATTSYDWLLIKNLWVDDAIRDSGLGSRLVELAEQEGRRLGCHSAWLDTSSPAAHAFYLNRGYQEFGVLANRQDQRLPAHRRWFLKKSL